MAAIPPIRLVICVDGTWCDPDKFSSGNRTNVFQLYMCVKEGQCYDAASGKTFVQEKRYVTGIGSADNTASFERAQAGVFGKGFQDQIRTVYEECCKLGGPDDEVWLYGFSRGAYVARAVAGLLHNLTALKSAGQKTFNDDYKKALKIHRQQLKQPEHGLGKRYELFPSSTRRAPKIQFVGVFDTIKAVSDDDLYDIALNNSTKHMRHALALHEDRQSMTPEYIWPVANGKGSAIIGRTFLQAWFVGAHVDVGGSAAKAGLSLYPLQWMLIESHSCGLDLGFSGVYGGRLTIDNPLEVVFPPTPDLGQGDPPWTCTSANGVTTTMQDLRKVHELQKYEFRYSMLLNRKKPHLGKKKRTPFDSEGNLNGFFPWAPQGTFIHPSVYFLLDEYASIAFATQEADFQMAIEGLREPMLGTYNGKVVQGFWTNREIQAQEMPALRVLVCGNSGIGKSTLINKVFGVEVTKSSSRERGIHNVEEEIKFAGRPDLVVHDSGGFEAARADEMDQIEKFLKDRSKGTDLATRLHVIWFCIDLSDERPKQASTVKLFKAVSDYAADVPIVLVGTKSDKFTDQKAGELRRQLRRQGRRVTQEELDDYAEAEVEKRAELLENEMREIPGGRCDACVAVSAEEDPASVENLTKTTAQCFSNERVRLLYIRAQTSSIELKVSSAVNDVLKTYKAILGSATGAALVPLGASSTRYGAAVDVCKKVLNHFGLPNVSADTAVNVVRANVWERMGNNFAMLCAEGIAGFGLFMTVASGGFPFFLASTLINLPIVIPATTRLFLMLAADLIIILARSFKDAGERRIGQPEQRDLLAAAKAYRPFAPAVHKQIGKSVPKRNMFASYQVGKVSRNFRATVEEYKAQMIEGPATERPKKCSNMYDPDTTGSNVLSPIARSSITIDSITDEDFGTEDLDDLLKLRAEVEARVSGGAANGFKDH